MYICMLRRLEPGNTSMRKATRSFTASNPKLWKYQYFTSTCSIAHLVEHPVRQGDAEWKHTSLPGDAERKHTRLLRTPCYTGRRGMKTHKSSKNTLLHRATRNENTKVIQEHPVTPGDAEWKHKSHPRTPCYTGRRGMKTHKSSKNTLLHRATRNENTKVMQEHPVTPGDAEWKRKSHPRTPCYIGRRGMKT